MLRVPNYNFYFNENLTFLFAVSLNNFIVAKRCGFWYNPYYPPAKRVAFCCVLPLRFHTQLSKDNNKKALEYILYSKAFCV